MSRLILQSFSQRGTPGTPDSKRTKPGQMTRGKKPLVKSEWRTKHSVRPHCRRFKGRSNIWLIYGREEIPSPRGKTLVQIKFPTYSLPALPEGLPRPSHQRGQYHSDLASRRGKWHRAEGNEETWAGGWKRRRRREREQDRWKAESSASVLLGTFYFTLISSLRPVTSPASCFSLSSTDITIMSYQTGLQGHGKTLQRHQTFEQVCVWFWLSDIQRCIKTDIASDIY